MIKRYHKLLLVIALGACWGPSFYWSKVALNSYKPIDLVFYRIIIAVACLMPFGIKHLRAYSISASMVKKIMILSLFSTTIPYLMFAYAIESVMSVTATLIMSLMPILTTLLAHSNISDERMNTRSFTGILLGCFGFVIIFIPTILDGKVESDTAGMLFVLIAAVSNSIGAIFARKNISSVSPYVAAFLQLCFAALFVSIILYFSRASITPIVIETTSISLIMLSVISTVAAFIVYFKLVKLAGATILSTAYYVAPIIGILVGIIFLGEKLSWFFVIASLTIFLGIYFAHTAKTNHPQS